MLGKETQHTRRHRFGRPSNLCKATAWLARLHQLSSAYCHSYHTLLLLKLWDILLTPSINPTSPPAATIICYKVNCLPRPFMPHSFRNSRAASCNCKEQDTGFRAATAALKTAMAMAWSVRDLVCSISQTKRCFLNA